MLNFDLLSEQEIREKKSLFNHNNPGNFVYHPVVTDLKIQAIQREAFGTDQFGPITRHVREQVIEFLFAKNIVSEDSATKEITFNVVNYQAVHKQFMRDLAFQTADALIRFVSLAMTTENGQPSDRFTDAYHQALISNVLLTESGLEAKVAAAAKIKEELDAFKAAREEAKALNEKQEEYLTAITPNEDGVQKMSVTEAKMNVLGQTHDEVVEGLQKEFLEGKVTEQVTAVGPEENTSFESIVFPLVERTPNVMLTDMITSGGISNETGVDTATEVEPPVGFVTPTTTPVEPEADQAPVSDASKGKTKKK